MIRQNKYIHVLTLLCLFGLDCFCLFIHILSSTAIYFKIINIVTACVFLVFTILAVREKQNKKLFNPLFVIAFLSFFNILVNILGIRFFKNTIFSLAIISFISIAVSLIFMLFLNKSNIFKTKCAIIFISLFTILLLFNSTINCIFNYVTYDKTDTYNFSKQIDFEKCKELYAGNETPYIILEKYPNNNALYVRELENNNTDFIVFETHSKMEAFIEKNTLGENLYVPPLFGEVTFNKKDLSVTYQKAIDVPEKQYQDTLNFNFLLLSTLTLDLIIFNIILLISHFAKNRRKIEK